jgi:hypothetical protein
VCFRIDHGEKKNMRLKSPFLLLLAAALVSLPADAQTDVQADGSSRVVVQLRPDIDLDSFARLATKDPRLAESVDFAQASPAVLGAVQSLERVNNFRSDRIYSHSIQGFAARLSAAQIRSLENNSLVLGVEADTLFWATSQIVPWGVNKIDADTSSVLAGHSVGGELVGVDAYVIDTGVDVTHRDLHVVQHINFVAGSPNTDCNGHGTHVAGIIGALDNTLDVVGVAPGIPMHGVKVMACDGTGWMSDVIAGVDWVTKNAKAPAVVNMSLTGYVSSTLDAAVKSSAAKGLFYAVAAGNFGEDACNESPARLGGANKGIMTVAATDQYDREPYWSNYGKCVDIWAPGVSIPSLKLHAGYISQSGTSESAPHVAGTAAIYLSRHPTASPAAVEAQLKYNQVTPGTRSKDGRVITRIYAGSY